MTEIKAILHAVELNRGGEPFGIYSVCSANSYVLRAAMLRAKKDNSSVLIEATSNQVDQYGGYTGMKPADFMDYLKKIAEETGLPYNRVISGGDHLGPNAWQQEQSQTAMEKARVLIDSYVRAGFEKIHLDASMPCADDPRPLPDEIIAERAAELALAAETTSKATDCKVKKPIYVIGTEVPVPGGAKENIHGLEITSPEDVDRVIELNRKAFRRRGLEDAWERVIAVVVQPGVEFDEFAVVDYNKANAAGLSKRIIEHSGFVYEAHSTDYQKRTALRQMVGDHFAILKVGPWLTYAMREAVFSLAEIEREWLTGMPGIALSNIRQVIEKVMVENPIYWKKYHRGDENELALARKYSLSDRIRYYWPNPEIKEALEKLIRNLNEKPVPLTLLSQFMPSQYEAVREGCIKPDPEGLIIAKIDEVLGIYSAACDSGELTPALS